MPQFIIERTIPGAGAMTDDEWKGASGKSNDTIDDIGGVTWIHSYVAKDKIFCLYETDDPSLIYKHGEQGGFPVDEVHEVVRMISPATAG